MPLSKSSTHVNDYEVKKITQGNTHGHSGECGESCSGIEMVSLINDGSDFGVLREQGIIVASEHCD